MTRSQDDMALWAVFVYLCADAATLDDPWVLAMFVCLCGESSL